MWRVSLSHELSVICPPIIESEKQDMLSIISNKLNILGRGGFGIVFKNNNKAIKVVKVDLRKQSELKNLAKEVEVSKNLSDTQGLNLHVPNFDFCMELDFKDFGGVLMSYFNVDEDSENQAHIHSSQKENSHEIEINSEQIGFMAISMEKMDHDLDWFNNTHSGQMILLERIRMFRSLGEHLQFISETREKNHCDIKPANFMLKKDATVPVNYIDTVGAMTIFPSDFVNSTSRVIDFGGVVDKTAQCKVYTAGFVPLDDVLYQGDSLAKEKSSSKNDVYALGMTNVLASDVEVASSIRGFSVFFFLRIKAIQKMINTVYNSQITEQQELFSAMIKMNLQDQIREMTIQTIAPQIITILDFLFELFKMAHVELGYGTEETDEQLIIKWFSQSHILIGIIGYIFEARLEILDSQSQVRANYEALQLFNSFSIKKNMMPDYKEQVLAYVGLEKEYVGILRSTLSLDKQVRPEFHILIPQLKDLEMRTSQFISELKAKSPPVVGRNSGSNTVVEPNLVNFNKFLVMMHQKMGTTAKNQRILLKEKKSENLEFSLEFTSQQNLISNLQLNQSNPGSSNINKMMNAMDSRVRNDSEVKRVYAKTASERRMENPLEDFIAEEISKKRKMLKIQKQKSVQYIII